MSYNFDKFLGECASVARTMNHRMVTVDHVALVVLQFPSITAMFNSMDIDPQQFRDRIEQVMNNSNLPGFSEDDDEDTKSEATMYVSELIQDLKKKSVMNQFRTNDIAVEPYFILFECLGYNDTVLSYVLSEMGISLTHMATDIQEYVVRLDNGTLGYPASGESVSGDEDSNKDKPRDSGVRRNSSGNGGQQRQKLTLEQFTRDMNDMATKDKLSPLIGRESELHDMMQVLSRRTKQNPVLVGEPGTGKTQIVDGLVRAIVEGNVPESIKGLKVLALDLGSLMAGTKYRGEFEERVDFIIKEMKKKTDTILFIDELHNMMGAGSGSSGAMDMSNMLKPALSNGELRIIGATTITEFRQHIEKDGALSRRFMKIDVVEPTLEETRKIVKGIQHVYEDFHGVKYSKEAFEAVIQLSYKYINNKRFPDKAIDLMDAAGARNRVAAEPLKVIGKEQIEKEVSRIANLPLEIIACEESERILNLPKVLRQRVFGQDDAIDTLVDNVMIARAGLREHNSIQSAFMFVGPSGTGKTEITKALSDALGNELIRFDMSEFAQEFTVSKLIGSPPGYVGHDAGNGLLLDKIEQFPNAVLLLDEIEKANPKVLLTFLQVMDEGHLTGSQGKKVSFRNVTLIMTTNLGAANHKVRAIGASAVKGDGIDQAIKEALRPEFLNRIDSIVKFNELSTESIGSIVDKFIKGVNSQMRDRKVKVTLTKAAKKWLIENGVEPGMGARPMKRCINENIKKPLAREVLVGSLKNGGVAKFDLQDGKIVLVDNDAAKAEEDVGLAADSTLA